MNRELRRSVWPIVAAVIVLPVLYVAAYFSLIERRERLLWQHVRTPELVRNSEYPHPMLGGFFAPAHWADRNFARPEYWKNSRLINFHIDKYRPPGLRHRKVKLRRY